MSISPRRLSLTALLALLLCVGCAAQPKTNILLNAYVPEVRADLSSFQGRPVYLDQVTNQAYDTTTWQFFNVDNTVGYEGAPTLHHFFRDSIEKALITAGLRVMQSRGPSPNTPALRFFMKSVTEERLVFEVKVLKGDAVIFFNSYKVYEAPPAAGSSPRAMEERIYGLINRLINTILADHQFRRALMQTWNESI
jgi:hypothetical protein